MSAADIVLWVLGGHLALGAVVGLAFVSFGVGRLDEAARGSSIAFRVMILPGCVVLWPLVVRRWIAGASPEVES